MIHTFAGDFDSMFQLVATVLICAIVLGGMIALCFTGHDPKNKNKKAS